MLVLFGPLAGRGELAAQQRIYATVQPNQGAVTESTERYDPAAGTFGAGSLLGTARSLHTANLLSNGKVLIAGGYNGGYVSTAETYDPATRAFSATKVALGTARRAHTATAMSGGKVLVAGGYDGTHLATAEIYDPSTNAFSAATSALVTARSGHTATLVAQKVVLIGGYNGTYLASSEVYDPTAATFSTSGSLATARSGHTATLLGNGKLLVVGGYNGAYLKAAELYDPATGAFTATGSLTTGRSGHTATLLSNGRVLIAGGTGGSPLDSAEIYDPGAGTFSVAAGRMTSARTGHAAAALAGGKVLVTGGDGGGGDYLGSAEIFDEATGRFTAAAAMTDRRSGHTATVLNDGSVLLAGGERRGLLTFDVNLDQTDNVSPNILFSSDSASGYVSYTGSGVVVVFSPATGQVLNRIRTEGKPAFMTALRGGAAIAVVSALENRIFVLDTATKQVSATFTFANATFGFGSVVALSPDGNTGFVSSTGSGEVIKFNVSDGRELARLKGLQGPARITPSKDGATLFVVDTLTEEVVFVDAAGMTRKTSFKARDTDTTANFTIFNDVVLSPGGESAVIASREVNGRAFVFKTASGELLATVGTGTSPGHTTITPDGRHWVVFADRRLTVIPTSDPAAPRGIDTPQSNSVGSATLAFTPDSRHVFYASADTDYVFEQDLETTAAVGRVLVGEQPNTQLDQPSTVVMAPDGKRLAVLVFVKGEIALLSRATMLSAVRFRSGSDEFTGVTVVNLSAGPARLTFEAVDNFGELVTGAGIENPQVYDVPAGSQLSLNVAQIFKFNPGVDKIGWLRVTSDQREVVGFAATGRARLTFLGFYLEGMTGVPLFQDRLFDFIVPEVVRPDGSGVELDFVNPAYNQASYTATRYSGSGLVVETRPDQPAYLTNRQAALVADTFTQPTSGQVLFMGGNEPSTTNAITATTEFYDPATQLFTQSGSMATVRLDHSATVLPDGKVLVAGGNSGGTTTLSSAELFDRTTGIFTATSGSMVSAREQHTATLLGNGKVLLAGGRSAGTPISATELYTPATQSFAATAGPMSGIRVGHTATLLLDGRVLIAGGRDSANALATAEIYDPASDGFVATGSLKAARAYHSATLLASGRVLIAGGESGSSLSSAELYDPATGTFTTISGAMTAARQDHTATLLADGRVLIAGGFGTAALSSAEIYGPSAADATVSTFTATGAMTVARRYHTATLLPGGSVMMAGGATSTTPLASAEFFGPTGTGTFTAAPSGMTLGRSRHVAVFLEAGDEGYLRIKSKAGVIFTEFYGTGRTQAAINGIPVPSGATAGPLYGPLFPLSRAAITTLSVINSNANPADLILRLHRADGSLIGGAVTRTLLAGAQLKSDLAALFGNTSGAAWIGVQASVDQVVGTLSVATSDEAFLATYPLQNIALTRFVLPFGASDGSFRTGVALLNPGDKVASVTVELWGPGGTLDRSVGFTLPPGGASARYLTGLFSGLDNRLTSNLRITSDQPLHAISVMHDRDFNFLMAIPPNANPTAGSSTSPVTAEATPLARPPKSNRVSSPRTRTSLSAAP